jgi:hypothetical protein
LIASCQAKTPDFLDLEFSSMFTCLCSQSGSFVPTVWDGAWSTCLEWASTAEPSEYSLFGPSGNGQLVTTMCEQFATNTSGFPGTTAPPTPVTTSPTKSSEAGYAAIVHMVGTKLHKMAEMNY